MLTTLEKRVFVRYCSGVPILGLIGFSFFSPDFEFPVYVC